MGYQLLKNAFYQELEFGKSAFMKNDFKTSFYHLENAHILGQKHIIRHTISHFWMLSLGFKTKNRKEIFGQVLRMIASLLFTFIWVPKGNTGGANVSAIKKMVVRKELQKYF
jgi:hypothetical protein